MRPTVIATAALVLAAGLTAPTTMAATSAPVITTTTDAYFIRKIDGIGNLYKATATATGQYATTSLQDLLPGNHTGATVSPDGTKLAVTDDSNGIYTLTIVDLAHLSDDSYTPPVVATGLEMSPAAWAGNGTSLAVSYRATGSAATTRPHVRIYDIAGELVRDLPNTAPAYYPALSPDGAWVAYAAGTRLYDKSFPLMLVPTQGQPGAEVKILKGFGSGGAMDVQWIPNSSYIGYTTYTNAFYGPSFVSAWGDCAQNITFADQPSGTSGAAFWRMGGFVNNSTVMVYLQDTIRFESKLRTFTITPCVRSADPLGEKDVTVADPRAMISLSSSFTGGPPSPMAPKFSPRAVVTGTYSNFTIRPTFPTPLTSDDKALSYLWGPYTMLCQNKVTGAIQLGGYGFTRSAICDQDLTASTSYELSAQVSSWGGKSARVAGTFITPEATVFDVQQVTPKNAAGRPGAVAWRVRLYYPGSNMPVPYASVKLMAKTSSDTSALGKVVASANTDGDGYATLEYVATEPATLTVYYGGDSKRFGAVYDLAVSPVTFTLDMLQQKPGKKVNVLKFRGMVAPRQTMSAQLQVAAGTSSVNPQWKRAKTVRFKSGKVVVKDIRMKTSSKYRLYVPAQGQRPAAWSTPVHVYFRTT